MPGQFPPPDMSGADNFLQLSDTPSAYTGQAGKAVLVNTAENGVEFGTASIAKIAARVYRSTAQSIPNATETAVSFDTERFDYDNMWSAASPTRITINTAGVYVVTGAIQWATISSGHAYVALRVNGTTYIATQRSSAPGTTLPLTIAGIWEFSVGDYVEMMVHQASGAALNLNASPAMSPELAVVRIA